jgi:NAD(P)-dependent dehydrogenase (short-subunit alcohol dehydrogenase family)
MTLAGRKALVTGGKRRIGRGIALALAEAGCEVGINDLEEDEDARETLRLIEGFDRQSAFFAADISSASQVERMVAGFVQRFGGIDILVNNPFYARHQPFLDIEEGDFDRTLAVCLKGFFLCSQQAARRMVIQGRGGNILSISSVHAHAVWDTDTCYGVAKAAILRLNQSMAVELGKYQIRCNVILPGFMDTDHVFGEAPPPFDAALGPPRAHHTSTLRPSTPEEIGRAAVFLASPAAGNITGVALPVDGGLLAG